MEALVLKFAVPVLRFLLLLYGGLLLFAFFGSERMIFAPQPASYRDDDPDVVKLTTADGTIISAMHLTNAAARFTILYGHGNAEDIGHLKPLFAEIRYAGFNVLAYDYPGYGTSAGRPTERGAYQAIDAAWRHLTGTLGIAPSNIILLGRSVGSGPAVDLAARETPAGLILESAFTSTFRVMTHRRLLPFDRFNNLGKIGRVKCPLLMIHGTADTIIPPWHGRALYAAAREPKRIQWIEGADHNDLLDVAGANYFRLLREFAASLAPGS